MFTNMFLVIFGTSLLVGFSGALAPGPVTAVNVRDSIIDGPKVGFLLSTGHAICELFIVIVLLVGIAPFVSSVPVRIVIGIMGGSFLLYLSYKGFRSNSNLTTMFASGHPPNTTSMSYIYKGILVSIGNPYFIVWWSTVGLNYILWSYVYGTVGILCFYFGHIISDYIWNCTLSFGVHHGKKFMSGKIYPGVMFSLNVFIGVLGVFFVYDSMLRVFRL